MGATSKDQPVSNRNTRIMANFVEKKLGRAAIQEIFRDLPFPDHEGNVKFENPEEFYKWEYGWHSLDTYNKTYLNLRHLFGPDVYEECGATVGKFVDLGSMKNMRYALGGVEGALRKVPEINKVFNDTKEFIILDGPKREGNEVDITYIIRLHDDIDPHMDWKSDPHIRGILSQTACVWGLPPGKVSQLIVPYSLEKLCEREFEFERLDLDPHMSGDRLFIRDPITRLERVFAERVSLTPADISGERAELISSQLYGTPIFDGSWQRGRGEYMGFRAIQDLKIENDFKKDEQGRPGRTILIPEGTILSEGLYFVTNYRSLAASRNPFTKLSQALYYKYLERDSGEERDWVEAHMALTQENKAKEAALRENRHLIANLENRVEERTRELKEEQEKRQHAETMAAVTYLHIGMAHNLRNPLKAIEVLMNQQASTCENLLMDSRFLKVWGIEESDQGGLVSFLQEKYNGKAELKDIDTGVATTIGKQLKTRLLEIDPEMELSVRQARNLATYNVQEGDLAALQPYFTKYSLETIMEILDYTHKIKSPRNGAKKKFTEAYEIINSTMNVAEMVNREDHETDLNQGITKILSEYNPIFQEQEVRIFSDLQMNLPKINMDTRFIDTIYHNLISNALYAIRPFSDKREITFKTYSNENKVIAEIIDTGMGIPEENISKIFLPFFSTKPEGYGKGIGLYSVHEIMNLYGGIEVSSKERETKFTLIFETIKKTKDI